MGTHSIIHSVKSATPNAPVGGCACARDSIRDSRLISSGMHKYLISLQPRAGPDDSAGAPWGGGRKEQFETTQIPKSAHSKVSPRMSPAVPGSHWPQEQWDIVSSSMTALGIWLLQVVLHKRKTMPCFGLHFVLNFGQKFFGVLCKCPVGQKEP